MKTPMVLPSVTETHSSRPYMQLLKYWHHPQDHFNKVIFEAAFLALAGRTVLMRLDTPGLEDPRLCSSRSEIFEEAHNDNIPWDFSSHTPQRPFGKWLQVSGVVQDITPEQALQHMQSMDVDFRIHKTPSGPEVLMHLSGHVPFDADLRAEELLALQRTPDLDDRDVSLMKPKLQVLRQQQFYQCLSGHVEALPLWLQALIGMRIPA